MALLFQLNGKTFYNIDYKKQWNYLLKGQGPDLVVMRIDSWFKGRRFESQWKIINGIFKMYLLKSLFEQNNKAGVGLRKKERESVRK